MKNAYLVFYNRHIPIGTYICRLSTLGSFWLGSKLNYINCFVHEVISALPFYLNYLKWPLFNFYSTIGKVEKVLKGSLDLTPSPSPSVKIQIMSGKVKLRCKGKTLLGFVNKLIISFHLIGFLIMFCFLLNLRKNSITSK